MARIGVNYETVKQTAIKLLSQGMAPSVQKIRETLGTGSNTTIAEHLKVWRDEYAKTTLHHFPANMPKELISTFEVLWQTAMEHAQNQLIEYKKAMESECAIAMQKEKDAEKMMIDMQLKLNETSGKLEQEIENKQKLIIELTLAKNRLITQDETVNAQKIQYEDRLKRAYEEKDNFVAKSHLFQTEIKTLHEKLISQTEEHKKLLTQQNANHEQSEIRWLKLIDHARQEIKEERKKLEVFRNHSDAQFQKMSLQIANMEKEKHEKDVQLKMSQEYVIKLKQEVKLLEIKYIKARATIMKFEDKQKLKTLSQHASKKLKSLKKNG